MKYRTVATTWDAFQMINNEHYTPLGYAYIPVALRHTLARRKIFTRKIEWQILKPNCPVESHVLTFARVTRVESGRVVSDNKATVDDARH